MPNLLYKEKSPYLLQHADNPIDWFPWCEDAFLKASKEDKPIFLSIGYSTCYWCHKMAREAFSDEKIAKYLNDNFICVKVDREERPDIDLVYMEAALCMSENAGWPLNIFLTTNRAPFFVGTYFSNKKEKGSQDFLTVLQQIKKSWIEERASIEIISNQVMDSLDLLDTIDKENISDKAPSDALWGMKSIFDNNFGGFGGAPKFPIAQQIFFLLRYWYLYRDEYALYMVEKTLDNIYAGEIYDSKNGGLFRYSTTVSWSDPHYEKMLYTNALMSMAYLEAYEVIMKDNYKNAVNEILGYMKKKLLSPEGGFYSAEDSEIINGKMPFIDQKISSGWNGLSIAAFAMAGKVLEEPKYIEIAKAATKFVLEKLYKKNGNLNAYYIKGNSFGNAYATDYSFFIWGLLELYQATYEEEYLNMAIKLNNKIIEEFWDEEKNGVYFYSKNSEKLILNPKEIYDGAIPSVNSICAMNFIRLSRLTKDTRLNKLAKNIFENVGKEVNRNPADYLYMLCAVLYEKSTKEVVVVEKDNDILSDFNMEFKPFTMEMPIDNFEQ